MNQILLTGNENNKKDNKTNKYKNSNNNDMKKIILFFGIVILIFGISIVGVYSYRTKNNKKEKTVTVQPPQLSLEKTEKEVKVIAKATSGIDKIIYTWNDDDPREVKMNGRTEHEEKFTIPEGRSNLNVKVVDKNGKETEKNEEFLLDTTNPIIEERITVTGDGTLKITATDNVAMQYMTYKWNDEEEVRIDVENEGETTQVIVIKAKVGNNTLTITAVDAAGNTEIKYDVPVEAYIPPHIEANESEGKIYIKISHDKGMKKIVFKVNNQEIIYDENYPAYDGTSTELEFKFSLAEGENTLEIEAISNEGEKSRKTFEKTYNYQPQPEITEEPVE